ncbi:hypothetical protein BN1708_001126, partial [Verticillium longisporum]
MAEYRRAPSRLGSSALLPAGHDADTTAVRPRNRRLISTDDNGDGVLSTAKSSSSLFSSFNTLSSRNPSPLPFSRSDISSDHRSTSNPPDNRGQKARNNNALGLLESSLTQSWTSLQGFASSLITGETGAPQSNGRQGRNQKGHTGRSRQLSNTWGPQPLSDARPSAQDIAAGSLAQRQAALKAVRTAAVLESHEGVNGGLDVAGKYKRRTSDEFGAETHQEEPQMDQLVYIHHVQPSDTYAGIVLRYRCREDALRRTNGLWSRDVQMRRWLALPVDACEIRGRPSEPPSRLHQGVDFLAPTPDAKIGAKVVAGSHTRGNMSSEEARQQVDFFSLPKTQTPVDLAKSEDSGEPLWTHVRWVSLDSFPQPVEIARVSRKTIGYFPPRRKKSLHTASTMTTPRQSLDASAVMESYEDSPGRDSALSSRRLSTLSNRPVLSTTPGRSTSTSTRSRGGSTGTDSRPSWMRRPGGVGSMGKNARAPGPEKDYFNSWAKKHIPAIAIDEHLPSISVMGSETARIGFGKQQEQYDSSVIVESPFDEGQDLTTASKQGSGLDRAAAQVETWLRGAFARRPSASTPGAGRPRGDRQLDDLDLIELADATSEDGRLLGPGEPGPSTADPVGSEAVSSEEATSLALGGTVRGRVAHAYNG